MKIDQNRIDPLLQQEQTQKSSPASVGKGFDEVLAREGAVTEQTAQAAPLPPPGAAAGFDPRFVSETAGTSAVAALSLEETEKAVSGLDGLLDELDNYARDLNGASESHLRGAFGRLENIESRVAALKSDPAVAGNTGLSGLVNEIEVLAATEKFKFNRGDYL